MKKLIVLYDNWCPSCRGLFIVIKRLDWFKRLSLQGLRNFDGSAIGYVGLDANLAKMEIASYSNTWIYGFDSLLRIALRLPALWILLPLLWGLKVSKLGQCAYRYIASRRMISPVGCAKGHCSVNP